MSQRGCHLDARGFELHREKSNTPDNSTQIQTSLRFDQYGDFERARTHTYISANILALGYTWQPIFCAQNEAIHDCHVDTRDILYENPL